MRSLPRAKICPAGCWVWSSATTVAEYPHSSAPEETSPLSRLPMPTQRPIHRERLSTSSGRLSPATTTSTTPKRVPIRVPRARNRLFSTSMPRTGWDTAHTVIAAHCGWSSPISQATTSASQEARAVRRPNPMRATSKPRRASQGVIARTLLIYCPAVEQTDPAVNQLQSVEHRFQLRIGQVSQHLLFYVAQLLADLAYGNLARLGQHDQFDATVLGCSQPLDVAAAFERIEQTNQAGAINAHQRGEFLLTDAVAGFGQMDQGSPADIGQTDGGHLLVDGSAPEARQHGKPDTETIPG